LRGAFYSVAVYELDWSLMRVRTLRCVKTTELDVLAVSLARRSEILDFRKQGCGS